MMGADRLQHVQYPQQGCIAFFQQQRAQERGAGTGVVGDLQQARIEAQAVGLVPLATRRPFGLEPGYRLAEVVQPNQRSDPARRAVQRQPQGLGGPSPTAPRLVLQHRQGHRGHIQQVCQQTMASPLIALGPEVSRCVIHVRKAEHSFHLPSLPTTEADPELRLSCDHRRPLDLPHISRLAATGRSYREKKMPLFGHRFQPSLGARTGPEPDRRNASYWCMTLVKEQPARDAPVHPRLASEGAQEGYGPDRPPCPN